MEVRYKSCIIYSVLILICLILYSALMVSYLKSEISWNNQLLRDEKISTNNSESSCDDGWTPYEHEKCLKLFHAPGLLNYANAERHCKEQSDSYLVSVDVGEKQKFVEKFLISNSVADNVWIGLKYENDVYQWTDGTQFRYSNWANGSPKNDTSYCCQMQTETEDFGLWSEESCEEKKLVVCERAQHWSFAQLPTKVMNLMRSSVQQRLVSDARFSSSTNADKIMNLALSQLKTSLADSTVLIQHLNSTLTQVKTNLTNRDQTMNLTLTELKTNLTNAISNSTDSILPVGFIYVQLPKEKSPTETWPWMVWKDISSEYAGLFFRTEGGNAAPFGEIQNADSPRLISMQRQNVLNNNNLVHVSADGEYSKGLGLAQSNWNVNMQLRVKVSNGEVRPVNMAVRIWKRTK